LDIESSVEGGTPNRKKISSKKNSKQLPDKKGQLPTMSPFGVSTRQGSIASSTPN